MPDVNRIIREQRYKQINGIKLDRLKETQEEKKFKKTVTKLFYMSAWHCWQKADAHYSGLLGRWQIEASSVWAGRRKTQKKSFHRKKSTKKWKNARRDQTKKESRTRWRGASVAQLPGAGEETVAPKGKPGSPVSRADPQPQWVSNSIWAFVTPCLLQHYVSSYTLQRTAECHPERKIYCLKLKYLRSLRSRNIHKSRRLSSACQIPTVGESPRGSCRAQELEEEQMPLSPVTTSCSHGQPHVLRHLG